MSESGIRPIPKSLRAILRQKGVNVKLHGSKINVKTYEIWNPLSRSMTVKCCGTKVEKVDVPKSLVKCALEEYKARMYQNHHQTVFSRWYRGWEYSAEIE